MISQQVPPSVVVRQAVTANPVIASTGQAPVAVASSGQVTAGHAARRSYDDVTWPRGGAALSTMLVEASASGRAFAALTGGGHLGQIVANSATAWHSGSPPPAGIRLGLSQATTPRGDVDTAALLRPDPQGVTQKQSSYVIRVPRAASPVLADALSLGLLRRTTEMVPPRPGAMIYRPSGGVTAALHDHALQLGAVQLGVSVLRLPARAYRAVIVGSPHFLQLPGLAVIRTLIADGVPVSAEMLQRLLLAAHAAGRQADLPPQLVSEGATGVLWRSESTRLIAGQRGWEVLLTFDRVAGPPDLGRVGEREVHGVAVSRHPLATAVSASGTVVRAFAPQLPGVSSRVAAVARDVAFSIDRDALDPLSDQLARHASRVALEPLSTHPERPTLRSAAPAVLDWAASWLPAELRAAGVPAVRITLPAALPCPRCHGPVPVWGDACPVCGAAALRADAAARHLVGALEGAL